MASISELKTLLSNKYGSFSDVTNNLNADNSIEQISVKVNLLLSKISNSSYCATKNNLNLAPFSKQDSISLKKLSDRVYDAPSVACAGHTIRYCSCDGRSWVSSCTCKGFAGGCTGRKYKNCGCEGYSCSCHTVNSFN